MIRELIERIWADIAREEADSGGPDDGNPWHTFTTRVSDVKALLAELQSLSERIAVLEGENDRLSKAVCSDVLGGLLSEDENEALVAFVKELRRASLIKEGRD